VGDPAVGRLTLIALIALLVWQLASSLTHHVQRPISQLTLWQRCRPALLAASCTGTNAGSIRCSPIQLEIRA
jgi:hypothetical protein